MTGADSDLRIYIDLEYCYPGMTRLSGRPTSRDQRQVVQIAALQYDHHAGREVASLDVLVKPPFTRYLPSFFVELTGITQRQVDARGVDFQTALAELVGFCEGLDVYTFDQDWSVLQQNCAYHGLAFPFADRPFKRVKTLLSKWGIDPAKYSSGSLYKAAGLDMKGHVHNALHDVRSMSAAVYALDRTHPSFEDDSPAR
jgi:inhibitor of KinA sporulation pathway (predicted exonuclease)